MKIASTTFICDKAKCTSRFTSTADGPVGPYLDLTESGWSVHRRYDGWKHYCQDHGGES